MQIERVEQKPPGSPPHRLDYEVDGDVLRVTHTVMQRDPDNPEGAPVAGTQTSDTFDFTEIEAGGVVTVRGIESNLPVRPILAAHRDDAGEMHVTLLHWSDDRG